jgi:NAD/NADP transhydrogenase alpha subunit
MKTLTIFAAALLSAGVVFADAASADTGKTRAQVTAELAQARASGELNRLNSDQAEFFVGRAVSTKSRAQVQAELAQAQASGELALLNSEDSARFLTGTAVASTKTRAQVLAELKQSQQSGEFAALHSEDPTAIQRFAAQKAAKHVETLAE